MDLIDVEHALNCGKQCAADALKVFGDYELSELTEALGEGADVDFSRGKLGKRRVCTLAAVAIMAELHRRLESRELED